MIQKTSFTSKLKRIDYLGTLFVIFFVGCLLIALNFGQSYGLVSDNIFPLFFYLASDSYGYIMVLYLYLKNSISHAGEHLLLQKNINI